MIAFTSIPSDNEDTFESSDKTGRSMALVAAIIFLHVLFISIDVQCIDPLLWIMRRKKNYNLTYTPTYEQAQEEFGEDRYLSAGGKAIF